MTRTDREGICRTANGAARSLGHRPAISGFTIERNIDGAMIERIGRPLAPCECVIGREHAADESDNGDAVFAVVAQCVDIPPRIAIGMDDPCEVRSASRLEAAERPDSPAIGTPGPGC